VPQLAQHWYLFARGTETRRKISEQGNDLADNLKGNLLTLEC
jgi:hypothetical protein